MHTCMYGCKLWDLDCKYVSDSKVEWRKIRHHIWGLPYKVHNAIVHKLSHNIDIQLDTRTIVIACVRHCYQQNFTTLSLHLLQIINMYLTSIRYVNMIGLWT